MQHPIASLELTASWPFFPQGAFTEDSLHSDLRGEEAPHLSVACFFNSEVTHNSFTAAPFAYLCFKLLALHTDAVAAENQKVLDREHDRVREKQRLAAGPDAELSPFEVEARAVEAQALQDKVRVQQEIARTIRVSIVLDVIWGDLPLVSDILPYTRTDNEELEVYSPRNAPFNSLLSRFVMALFALAGQVRCSELLVGGESCADMLHVSPLQRLQNTSMRLHSNFCIPCWSIHRYKLPAVCAKPTHRPHRDAPRIFKMSLNMCSLFMPPLQQGLPMETPPFRQHRPLPD